MRAELLSLPSTRSWTDAFSPLARALGEAARKDQEDAGRAVVEGPDGAAEVRREHLELEISGRSDPGDQVAAGRRAVLVDDADGHVPDFEGDGIAEEEEHDDRQADGQVEAARIAPDVERLLAHEGNDPAFHRQVLPARTAAMKTSSSGVSSRPVKRSFNSRGVPMAAMRPAKMMAMR